jgi:AsmA protein
MRRWLLHLALLLVGVLAIAAGGVWYLASSLDTVALEAQLALAVRSRTGHDLSLEGLDVHLFPLPTLELQGVRVGAAPGFGPTPLLSVERARARLRLLPLARRELSLGAVVFEEPRLNLVRNEAGRGSWELWAERLAGQGDTGDTGGASLPVSVERIVTRRGRVDVLDEASARRITLLLDTLELGSLAGPGPVEAHLVGAVDSAEPKLRVELDLRGRGAWNGPGLFVDTLHGDVVVQGAQVPGGTQRLAVDAPFSYHPKERTLAFEDWRVEQGALGLSAQGALSDAGVEARLQVSAYDLRALLGDLGHAPRLADPSALESGSLAGWLSFDGERLAVRDLQLRVDDTLARGWLGVNLQHGRALRFELAADRLDLHRYRSADSDEGAPPTVPANLDLAGVLSVARLEHGGLVVEQLELPVSLRHGTLVAQDASARLLEGSVVGGLRAELSATPPRYRLWAEASELDIPTMLAASASGRKMTGTLELDLELTAAGSQREALVSSLDGRLCIAAHDAELPLARREGPAEIREGQEGWRARRDQERLALIRERIAALVAERVQERRPDRLHVGRVGACFALEDGLARTDDLSLTAQELRLEGAGEIDLPDESLDLACELVLEGLPPMQLTLTGGLDDPKVALAKPDALDVLRHRVEERRDAAQIEADRLRGELQERREDLREELRESASPAVERLLDQRERALERRDSAREKVREARRGLREQLEEARPGRRGDGDEEPGVPEDEPENAAPVEGATAPSPGR